MPDWPSMLADGQRTETLGTRTVIQAALLSPNAVANTPGAWVALSTQPSGTTTQGPDDSTAVTAFDCSGITIMTHTNTGAFRCLLDIGIGAAGSEVVLINNIMFVFPTAFAGGQSVYFPINIPKNTRIAGRIRSNATSGLLHVYPMLHGSGNLYGRSGYGVVETLGAVTASSRGTNLPTQSSANTLTGWTSIGTSTRPYEEIIISDQSISTALSGSTPGISVDIGIGDGTPGGTTVLIPAIGYKPNPTADRMAQIFSPLFPCQVKENTQFWARYQISVTFVGDSYDIILYGMS